MPAPSSGPSSGPDTVIPAGLSAAELQVRDLAVHVWAHALKAVASARPLGLGPMVIAPLLESAAQARAAIRAIDGHC